MYAMEKGAVGYTHDHPSSLLLLLLLDRTQTLGLILLRQLKVWLGRGCFEVNSDDPTRYLYWWYCICWF